MPRRRSPAVAPEEKTVEQYEHRGKKRANNPPVGLVTPDSDRDESKKKYAYDSHLDPKLEWSGKAERMSFQVTDRVPAPRTSAASSRAYSEQLQVAKVGVALTPPR